MQIIFWPLREIGAGMFKRGAQTLRAATRQAQ